MEYVKLLPEWLIILMTLTGLFSFIALVSAIIYRFVKYGIKLKFWKIEIDASEENDHEK